MTSAPDDLAVLMADDLAAPPPTGLAPLIDALRVQTGAGLEAVVLYGSCRRNTDIHEGLVDLMAVVSNYRAVHGTGPTAVLNAIIPPNVYYLEADSTSGRIRCKYIIVSQATLRRRMAGGLDGYFWARFTQPCRLVWSAGPDAADSIARARATGAVAFASRAATLGNGTVDAAGFWTRAVKATYGCELRPEPADAASGLIGRDPAFWSALSEHVLPRIDGVTALGPGRFDVAPGAVRRARGQSAWALRRIWSKALNIARLVKAAGTFANGVDYLSWKIERHSGVRVEPTDRMRRHPRIAAWGLLLRLWRSGAL